MRQVSLCHSVNFIKNKPYLDITTLFHAVQHVVHVGLTHVSIWQRFLLKDRRWRACRLEVQFVEIPRLVEFNLGIAGILWGSSVVTEENVWCFFRQQQVQINI